MKDQGFVLFCLFVEKLELSNSHCNTLLLNQMSFFTFLLPLYLLLAGNCRSYSNTSERERVTKSTSQNLCRMKSLTSLFFPLPLYWVTLNYHSLSQMHKAMQLQRERLHFLHIIFVYIVNSSVRWLNSITRLMCKWYLLECLKKRDRSGSIYLFIYRKAKFFSFHHRRAHKLFKCIFTIFKAFFENDMCTCVVNNPQKHFCFSMHGELLMVNHTSLKSCLSPNLNCLLCLC